MKPTYRNAVTVLLAVALAVCSNASNAPDDVVFDWVVEVVAEYPHDAEAFTQGLVFVDGVLYEGTGRYGQSTLRQVAIETGAVEREAALAPQYFGEGVAAVGERLIQLTWREQTAFVWDIDTFDEIETFSYTTEGWGLAYDGERLIMSDGTASLYFLDPDTYERIGQIEVRDEDGPVDKLNELEVVDRAVWANVWQTDTIVIIDPETGRVTGRIDASSLLDPIERPADSDGVLNGIAYDATSDRIVLTGKLWPTLFEIRLVER